MPLSPRDNEPTPYDRFLDDGRGSLPQTFLTIHSKYHCEYFAEGRVFDELPFFHDIFPSFPRLFLLYRYRVRDDEIYFSI